MTVLCKQFELTLKQHSYAVKGGFHAVGVIRELILEPAHQQAEERLLIERTDDLQIEVGDLLPVAFEVEGADYKRSDLLTRQLREPLMPDGLIAVEPHLFVIAGQLHEIEQAGIGVALFIDLAHPCIEEGQEDIEDIVEIVIKGIAGDAAVIGDIADGDLIQRLFFGKPECAFGYHPLGYLCHSLTSFFAPCRSLVLKSFVDLWIVDCGIVMRQRHSLIYPILL